MGLNRVAVNSEPVTLSFCKEHCRIDIETDDALLDAYISASREVAELETGRTLADSDWILTFDSFPDVITIPNPPLQTLTSIQYYDTTGTLQTLDSSDYIVDYYSYLPRITPLVGSTFPNTYARPSAVIVSYNAGDCSYAHGIAISILANHLYNTREPIVIGTILTKVPFHIRSLFAVKKNYSYK